MPASNSPWVCRSRKKKKKKTSKRKSKGHRGKKKKKDKKGLVWQPSVHTTSIENDVFKLVWVNPRKNSQE